MLLGCVELVKDKAILALTGPSVVEPALSYHLFQQLAVFFQPDLRFFHGRGLGANDIPESGGVVRLDEVGQLMDDGIVDDIHGRFDQTPVKIDIVV